MPNHYVIRDHGKGMDGTPEEIARLFSIDRGLMSSKLWRKPQRGALGKAHGARNQSRQHRPSAIVSRRQGERRRGRLADRRRSGNREQLCVAAIVNF